MKYQCWENNYKDKWKPATYASCILGITGTSPCFFIIIPNFEWSRIPSAFNTSAISLKKMGPKSAGINTANPLASTCFKLSNPCTALLGVKQVSPGRYQLVCHLR